MHIIDSGIFEGPSVMPDAFEIAWGDFVAPMNDPTVEDLFRVYYEYAKLHAKTHQEIAARFRRYFGPISIMKAHSLSAQHVQKWHGAVGERFGRPTANHCLRLVRTLYNHATRLNVYDGKNPASVVKAFREKSRERFLDDEEMPKFLEAVDNIRKPQTRDFFYILLFTGARSCEVLAMRWENINIRKQTWTVPDSKNGEDLFKHLDPAAMAALERRRPKSQNGWVFPGYKRSDHMAFPRREWERLRATFPNHLVSHDLRRTLATWELNTGADLEVVGESMGHRSAESTRVYARVPKERVRKAVGRAVRAMLDPSVLEDGI